MTTQFRLIESPHEALVQELASRDHENTFATPAVVRGMVLRGFVPCLLGLWEGERMVQGCLGAYKKGRLSRSLDVRLLPDVLPESPFWTGLIHACKRLGVWDLTLYAVSPRQGPIPELGPVIFSESGTEFFLDLKAGMPEAPTSTNHRRSLAKALKNGVVVKRTGTVDAVESHLALMDASMDRRMARGESVGGNAQSTYYLRMLEAGCGEFFQARTMDGVVLSSVFFLRSAASAYYQSAGTSPTGMSLGASPFLIWTAAGILRQEGVTKFCLGGSTLDNMGLVRFKSGFGSLEEPFQSTGFCLAHPLKRRLRELLGRLKK